MVQEQALRPQRKSACKKLGVVVLGVVVLRVVELGAVVGTFTPSTQETDLKLHGT